MREGIATIMLGIGGLWAILGVWKVVSVASNGDTVLLAFALIFNVVLFMLPGLIVVGIGTLLLTKAKSATVAPL